MHFTISKTEFLDGLAKVQGILGRKTSFQITQNVLISAEEDAITITATDLELGFSGTYSANIKLGGQSTIPGRKLFEIVKELPDEFVECRMLESGWIEISNPGVQYQIVGMDPEDFPRLPDVSQTSFFSLSADQLEDIIEKTNISGSLSAEEKRPHLIGVYLQKVSSGDSHGVRMVATDGNRLSKADIMLAEDQPEPDFGEEQGVIIPKKAMSEILHLVRSPGDVSMGVTGNYFVVKKDNEFLIGRLVEGEYPDYTIVIPKNIDTFFHIEKSVFQNILKRMSILTNERYRSVRFSVEKDKLRVRITNPEIGESREQLPITFNGQPFEAAFNPRFFLEAIGPMKSESLMVRLESDQKPCIIEGEKDPSYLAVIMPMMRM